MEIPTALAKEIDKYDQILDSHGRGRFEAAKKQCFEEGERNGFAKGFAEGFVKGFAKSSAEVSAQMSVDKIANEFAKEFTKWFAKVFAERWAETCKNIALNMLTSDYPTEEISKMTGLGIESIHQLAQNNSL